MQRYRRSCFQCSS